MIIDFKIIEAAILIAPKDDVRYYINGILFSKNHIVATDGSRLLVVPHSENVEKDFIIPIKAINTLRKQLTPKQRINEKLEVTNEYIECADMVAKYKPIDGNYPDYSRVIPKKYDPNFSDDLTYNWQFMVDFQKIDEILGSLYPFVTLLPNGEKSALVKFAADPLVIGVIMPIRK